MRDRDINKVLNQYKRLEDADKVKIYVHEEFNIKDKAIERAGGDDKKLLFSLIDTALQYGVAVGYAAGKRDGRAVRNRKRIS